MPALIYSPSAKFCDKGNEPGAKEVCFTGKNATLSDNSGNSSQAANEGSPTDPKVLEEQQKKLQEDLQKL